MKHKALLPDRGTLNVGLNELPEDVECTVRLSSLTNTPLRAVGENIGSPPNFRIKGTAIVSATQEDGPVDSCGVHAWVALLCRVWA